MSKATKSSITRAATCCFDITRKVRFGPGLMTGITDYSFELDDEGQPYWAISTYKNSRGFSLPEADGIILLNATTGQMDRYGMDEVPSGWTACSRRTLC